MGNLSLLARGNIGYFHGFLTDASGITGGTLYLLAASGFYYTFVPSFSLGLNGHFLTDLGLFTGIGGSLTATYHIPLKPGRTVRIREAPPPKPKPMEVKPVIEKGKMLQVDSVEFGPVFPVLFKVYDTQPVGKAILHNWEPDSIEDISVSFFVERYMDNPKPCSSLEALEGGKTAEVELCALFNDQVLEITEGTKVSAKIITEYTLKNQRKVTEHVETLRLYDRNAVTWDDDRKAAAFVTAKDPSVLEFSKNVTSWVKGEGSRALDPNLRIAIGLHEALRLFGVSYAVDPKTPFAELSQDKLAVDFLQFPRQTLRYCSGDCDDLSILYSALFEAVGIETAFITVPGHIFMAFCLSMQEDEARKGLIRADELIFREGKVWMPVEITKVRESFLKAWQEGAKEWRENTARGQATLYPMHEAWRHYEPVGLPGAEREIALPARQGLVEAYMRESTRLIERSIYPEVARLQNQIRESGNSPRYVNKLGILYARSGLTEKASAVFESVLGAEEYVPSLINLGNISYLKGEMGEALEYYERAERQKPSNATALLCLARTHHELENYGLVRQLYGRLRSRDSGLADQFAYLDLRGEEADRAAAASGMKEVILWEEE